MAKNSNQQMAELLLRSFFAILMFFSGLGKFLDYPGFVGNAASMFTNTMLPMSLVLGFLYIVPVVEVVTGLMLVFSYKRDIALFVVGWLFVIFAFGNLVTQQYDSVVQMLIYLLGIVAILHLPAYKIKK